MLPHPTVLLARRPGDDAEAGALVAACDVVVADETALAAVLAAVDRTPLAAAALVQVLRVGAGLSVSEGLVVESLAYAMLQGGPELAAWLASRPPRIAPPPASIPPVLVHRDGARLEITLNRSERHNAFSAAMRDGLLAALEVAVVEPAIRAVVLRGDGPSFCSGGDLDEFGTFPDPATAHAVRMTRSPARVLAGLAGRVRAEVHGACIGAGVELAAFCGRVVATGDAFFQLPEVGMGLLPGAGGTVSLPRRIGRHRTAELALGGRRIDAATALAWGLIDEIVPA